MPHNQSSPAFGYAHNIYFYTKPSEANRLAYTVVRASVKNEIQTPFSFPPKKRKKKKHETEITFTAPKEEERERGGENDESEIKDSFAAQKIWMFPLPFPDLQLLCLSLACHGAEARLHD